MMLPTRWISSCGAWPEDGSTQLCFGLLWSPLCPPVLFTDTLRPMMDRDVSWLRSLHSVGHWADWGPGPRRCSLHFRHAEPVNRGIPGSAHESTADQQNHSWHILAVNAKHNLTNSRLGKWMRRCQPSPNTQVDKYTQTFLNDCSNFAIALK